MPGGRGQHRQGGQPAHKHVRRKQDGQQKQKGQNGQNGKVERVGTTKKFYKKKRHMGKPKTVRAKQPEAGQLDGSNFARLMGLAEAKVGVQAKEEHKPKHKQKHKEKHKHKHKHKHKRDAHDQQLSDNQERKRHKDTASVAPTKPNEEETARVPEASAEKGLEYERSKGSFLLDMVLKKEKTRGLSKQWVLSDLDDRKDEKKELRQNPTPLTGSSNCSGGYFEDSKDIADDAHSRERVGHDGSTATATAADDDDGDDIVMRNTLTAKPVVGRTGIRKESTMNHTKKGGGVRSGGDDLQQQQQSGDESDFVTSISSGSSDSLGDAQGMALRARAQLTNRLAIDCEMVGVGDRGSVSKLARCSIINKHGQVVLDTYVQPSERVTDFRTFVSGIRPHHIKNAPKQEEVLRVVSKLVKGKVLIGHSIHHDLQALSLKHPRHLIRDTATYTHYKREDGKKNSLKKLARERLGIVMQEGEHSSVEDARATMKLYLLVKKQWEREVFTSRAQKNNK